MTILLVFSCSLFMSVIALTKKNSMWDSNCLINNVYTIPDNKTVIPGK